MLCNLIVQTYVQPNLLIYEDSDCVAINKPAGMPCHPLLAWKGDTALEWVGQRCPDVLKASRDLREGGLVHRLDTGTSGILVFARNEQTYDAYRAAFSRAEIRKTYVALVQGFVQSELCIEYAIAHHLRNRSKMIAITPKHRYFRGHPQPAQTFVKPMKVEGHFTRVAVQIRGGRRHQIRVHLAAVGHPLVGDSLYGDSRIDWRQGHALHADSLELRNGTPLFVAAPF